MASLREVSPRSIARAAGAFWLITFVAGMFAMVSYVKVVVPDDAVLTATNLMAREPFYRLGVVSNLIATVTYVAATVLVYYLLKPVNGNVALLAAFFSLIGCALSGVSFGFNLAPVIVLRAAPSPFTPEQVQELVRILLRVGEQASIFGFVFFGLHVLLSGYLIFQSTFVHRLVGVLMVFGGVGWLTFGFANLLSPEFGRTLAPWILLPGMLGEGALTLWLLTKGVDADRWKLASAPLVTGEI